MGGMTRDPEEPPPVPRIAGWLNERTRGRPTPAAFLHFHCWLYRTSGGRLGHGLIGAPSLVLTTLGRRSGRARVNVLVYARDGDRYVVAASNDGRDTSPAWLLNVRAQPRVAVQVGRRRFRGRAQALEASEADHPRLWALMNATNHDRYHGYQTLTQRPNPGGGDRAGALRGWALSATAAVAVDREGPPGVLPLPGRPGDPPRRRPAVVREQTRWSPIESAPVDDTQRRPAAPLIGDDQPLDGRPKARLWPGESGRHAPRRPRRVEEGERRGDELQRGRGGERRVGGHLASRGAGCFEGSRGVASPARALQC